METNNLKDFINYKNNMPSHNTFAVLLNPNYWAIVLCRISNWFYRIRLSPISKIIWSINRIVNCVDIDYQAKISNNVILVHGIGIVFGENCKIFQNVTIGGNGKKQR